MANRQKLFNYFSQEHGITLLDSDYNELDNYFASVEAEKWHFKKPRVNDKTMWGRLVLVERYNYVKDSYFSIEPMPLLGKIIRWCELPTPYQPEGREG